MTDNRLKIVFFGTPEFAVESLDALVNAGYDVAAVVTATDKVGGRGHGIIQSAVKQYAVAHNLPLLQPEKLRDPKFIAELQRINADLFVVIAFRMLPDIVWQMPRLGTFNLHASLLPKFRGAAPINWAIIRGEKESGVTTFFLKHEIDTGDIINQVTIPIGDDENVGSLYNRLMHIGAQTTVDTVAHIANGTLVTRPQDEKSVDASLLAAPKIFKETCRIDWTKPARDVHNFVRGLSPYPAAWTELHADTSAPGELKIFATRLTDEVCSQAPGTISVQGNRMLVATGDNMLEITELRPAGKRQMAADAYLRGARLVNPKFV